MENFNFKFDPKDALSEYLQPVFFEKEVLVRYLYDSRYRCEFCSETYGMIYFNGDSIPFGVNKNGKIIMWLGDVKNLPLKEKIYLLSYNTESDHEIYSEFYEAQINAAFTEPIKEVEIFIQKSKLNLVFQNKFGFNLFLKSCSEMDELFKLCSKYKKILIGGEDDFKRFISEWNEILIEDLNKKELKKHLNMKDEGVRRIKLLEKFIKKVLGVRENIILPYFVLYDLRIWSDHKECQEKFGLSIQRLKINKEDTNNYRLIYQKLVMEIVKFHDRLLKEVEKYAKT